MTLVTRTNHGEHNIIYVNLGTPSFVYIHKVNNGLCTCTVIDRTEANEIIAEYSLGDPFT